MRAWTATRNPSGCSMHGDYEIHAEVPGEACPGVTTVKSSSTPASEHRYFSAVSLAVAVTVLAGFVPFYTLRLLHHDPNLRLLVHAHGFVMASWISLFLAQTLLIARHRVELHRRLGVFGAGLAVLVLLVGVPTLVNAAARRSQDVHSPRFLLPLMASLWLRLQAWSVCRFCCAGGVTTTSG